MKDFAIKALIALNSFALFSSKVTATTASTEVVSPAQDSIPTPGKYDGVLDREERKHIAGEAKKVFKASGKKKPRITWESSEVVSIGVRHNGRGQRADLHINDREVDEMLHKVGPAAVRFSMGHEGNHDQAKILAKADEAGKAIADSTEQAHYYSRKEEVFADSLGGDAAGYQGGIDYFSYQEAQEQQATSIIRKMLERRFESGNLPEYEPYFRLEGDSVIMKLDSVLVDYPDLKMLDKPKCHNDIAQCIAIRMNVPEKRIGEESQQEFVMPKEEFLTLMTEYYRESCWNNSTHPRHTERVENLKRWQQESEARKSAGETGRARGRE